MYKNFTEHIGSKPRSCIYKTMLVMNVTLFLLSATFLQSFASTAAKRVGPVPANISITGKVTDDTGSPLPGVTIKERGTQNSVITDINGDFRISVTGENAILAFSYVGFKAGNADFR